VRWFTLSRLKSAKRVTAGLIDPDESVMRSTIMTLAAIILVIGLTTAWSISMLPRLRDVVATIQTPP
jgi:hypothetical protein